jgi:hypothetical protein
MLLWHVAEQFGRPVPNGAIVPALGLELLTEALDEPSPLVADELARLVDSGTLSRRVSGSYLLSSGGPDADGLRALAEAARRTAGTHRAQARRLQQDAAGLLAGSHPRVLRATSRPQVLLVSVEPPFAGVMRTAGHAVTAVSSGEDALAALADRPHVVVIDAGSVIGDESAFVDRLRTVPRARGTRVVLLVDPSGRQLPSPGLVALAHARATTLISPQRLLRLVEKHLTIARAREAVRPGSTHAEPRSEPREA